MAEDALTVEIRNYTRIAWRWSWLIVGLPALVVLLGLLRQAPQQTGYVANMRFSVGLVPEARNGVAYTYDRYYTWLTAEYLVDDLSEIVKSREVAQAVAQEAAAQGLSVQIAPGAIQSATGAGKLHRILTVSLSWPNPAELEKLANALATVLSEGKASYFIQARNEGMPIVMHLIDPPSIAPMGLSLRSRMDLPIRVSLALLAGMALAFFLEYLDDSVHGPADLRALGLDVLGTIPRASPLPWADRHQR